MPRKAKPAGEQLDLAGSFDAEIVSVDSLRPHPRNYRVHLAEQLSHIEESLREHGFYRNVVIARDNTILAGHGVVEAAKRMKLEKIPVIRLDVGPDDTRALKVLTGDNEVARLAEVDDALLTELLREVKLNDVSGLLGTGYDERQLAALIMVTRPASEIQDINAAAEWAGITEFDSGAGGFSLTLWFESENARDEFIGSSGLDGNLIRHRNPKAWTTPWPQRQRDDLSSLRIVEADD